MESCAHHYSKYQVKEWLETKWNRSRDSKYQCDANFGVLNWTVDCRYGPGVYIEYPLLRKLNQKDSDLLGIKVEWGSNYPNLDRDHLRDHNLRVEMILDIVVCDMGSPKYGIEIVHKHLCTVKKRELIRKLRPSFKVYELSADWVMSQLVNKIPTIIPLVELI